MPLSSADLARHLGVTRSVVSHALRAQERAKKAGRTYKGRVPLPTGYRDGKPYWII